MFTEDRAGHIYAHTTKADEKAIHCVTVKASQCRRQHRIVLINGSKTCTGKILCN